jgi:hypothetical protein
MRASYVERLDRFRCLWCVAIVLDASSIVKIEFRNGNIGVSSPPHSRRSPFLLQLGGPSYSIVATGGRTQ